MEKLENEEGIKLGLGVVEKIIKAHLLKGKTKKERSIFAMKTIHEKSRNIPVVEEVDVCVVGGSCTGVFAAVSAARLGAKVAIIENNGFFGGVATAGLVNVWHSLFDTTYQKQIIAGLTLEIIERLGKREAILKKESGSFTFNSPELTIELDKIITEARIRPFLHSRFVAPIIKGDILNAVIIENKTGRCAIRASYFIDATGDGDLIARMKLPYFKHKDMQPPTTCAIVYGLDNVEQQNPDFSLSAAVFNPESPNSLRNGFLWAAPVPNIPNAKMVAGTRVNNADCSNADELTKAEIEGRRQVRIICDILRKNFKGGESIALAALSSYIGVRETRHIRCLYTLTENDILSGRSLSDAIANGTYPADIHHSDKPGITFRHLDGREVYHVPGLPEQVSRWRKEQEKDPTFYQIPYKSLVPQGAKNVLVAGRIIDADRGAYGAVRVMVNCNQTGEAAGTAVYIALNENISVSKINTNKLRKTMKNQGAVII